MKRLTILALAVLALFVTGKAEAGLRLCNNANETIYTALGYQENDQWVAEGWWEVSPGNCTSVVNGNLTQRYYYVRAEGVNGTIWSGDYFFCTMQTRFLLVDRESCVSSTVDREGFWQIDTGDSLDHVHNFNP